CTCCVGDPAGGLPCPTKVQTRGVDEPPRVTSAAQCSAKGCGEDARWALVWNNPKIHTSDREKRWLACDTHRTTLAQFLSLRAPLRRTDPLYPNGQPPRPTHQGTSPATLPTRASATPRPRTAPCIPATPRASPCRPAVPRLVLAIVRRRCPALGDSR